MYIKRKEVVSRLLPQIFAVPTELFSGSFSGFFNRSFLSGRSSFFFSNGSLSFHHGLVLNRLGLFSSLVTTGDESHTSDN